ncbi:MAG: hypothetical protein IJ132_01600 [Firmicutes bacterium]|nr:hypothetical protein [Bacillota bacterium]
MQNRILEKAQKGEISYGTFSHLKSSVTVDALAYAGLDYFIVDTEHAPVATDEADELIALIAARGMSPVVRVKNTDRGSILNALDSGAHALIIPNLKTLDEAKRIVEYGKFTPVGERGFCPTRDCAWGAGPQFEGGMVEYMKQANENTLLIPQCETKECVEIVEEVINTPGIDGLFIGPMDLSINLGVPGDFDSPIFKDAVAKTVKACKDAGKLSLGFAGSPELAASYKAEGYSSIAYGVDVMMLQSAYTQALAEIGAGVAGEDGVKYG